jgi:hypothetical protein
MSREPSSARKSPTTSKRITSSQSTDITNDGHHVKANRTSKRATAIQPQQKDDNFTANKSG